MGGYSVYRLPTIYNQLDPYQTPKLKNCQKSQKIPKLGGNCKLWEKLSLLLDPIGSLDMVKISGGMYVCMSPRASNMTVQENIYHICPNNNNNNNNTTTLGDLMSKHGEKGQRQKNTIFMKKYERI